MRLNAMKTTLEGVSMWQCDNCGYTDENGTTFEEEVSEDNPAEVVRYCPECGSDEVYAVDDDEEENLDEDEEDDDFEDDDEEDLDEDEDEDEDWDDDEDEEDEDEDEFEEEEEGDDEW